MPPIKYDGHFCHKLFSLKVTALIFLHKSNLLFLLQLQTLTHFWWWYPHDEERMLKKNSKKDYAAMHGCPFLTLHYSPPFFRKLQFFFKTKRKHEFTIMLTSVFEVEPKEHQFHDRQQLSAAAGFHHLRNRILQHLTTAGRGGMAPVMMPAHRQNTFFGSYTQHKSALWIQPEEAKPYS